MAVFEMPLEQMYEYMGCNECPVDIDQYWDQAISEMELIGTSCQLIPAHFQVKDINCYEMYFTGVGGAKIHARFVKPIHIEKKLPAVCCFHGYTGNCGSFAQLFQWAASGFAAASMDCRGQGGQSEDIISVCGNTQHGHIIRGLVESSPDKMYYRNVFLDAAQLARVLMAMDDIDEKLICAVGGSQGGALTLACASLTPTIKCIAPRCPFLCDYRRVCEMDLDVAAYAELREYFRSFDPLHLHETEIFTKLGYIDLKNLTHRINASVLQFTGLMDTVCPPSTQFAAYNHIRSEKKIILYPDYRHEDYPEQDDETIKFFCEKTTSSS